MCVVILCTLLGLGNILFITNIAILGYAIIDTADIFICHIAYELYHRISQHIVVQYCRIDHEVNITILKLNK